MSIDATFAARTRTSAAGGDLRRQERRECDLGCSITTSHGEARIRLINISPGGIGFTADPVLAFRPADQFTLRHTKLGDLRCVVRWALHPRYGAEFDAAGKTSQTVRQFYDSLPPGPEKTG